MSVFSRLRIGRRLTLAFAVVVTLTVVSAAFSEIRLIEVKSMAAELTADQAERTSLAFRWRQNVAVNGTRAAMLAMITDATLAEPLNAKVKASSAETSTIQKRFAELEKTPDGLAIQAKLADVRQRYLSTRDALDQGDRRAARRSPPRSRRARRSTTSTRSATNTWRSATSWSPMNSGAPNPTAPRSPGPSPRPASCASSARSSACCSRSRSASC